MQNIVITATNKARFIAPVILLVFSIIIVLLPSPGAKPTGILAVLFSGIYFYYVWNMRIGVEEGFISYGPFLKTTIPTSEISEIKYGQVFFRGARAGILIITSKNKKIKIPTQSFKRSDLNQLVEMLKKPKP